MCSLAQSFWALTLALLPVVGLSMDLSARKVNEQFYEQHISAIPIQLVNEEVILSYKNLLIATPYLTSFLE